MNKERLDVIFAELKNRISLLGYDCAGSELINEDGMNLLRVYLDMPGGVDLSDCETVAREVTDYLDTVEKDLPEKYFLEVSSLGLERPFFSAEDYTAHIGKEARLVVKGNKEIVGLIKAVNENISVVIALKDGDRTVLFSDIKRGSLVYKKETGEKKTFKKIPKKKKK